MKFNFSSGITLAFGKCEPALKLNLSSGITLVCDKCEPALKLRFYSALFVYSCGSLKQLLFPVRKLL